MAPDPLRGPSPCKVVDLQISLVVFFSASGSGYTRNRRKVMANRSRARAGQCMGGHHAPLFGLGFRAVRHFRICSWCRRGIGRRAQHQPAAGTAICPGSTIASKRTSRSSSARPPASATSPARPSPITRRPNWCFLKSAAAEPAAVQGRDLRHDRPDALRRRHRHRAPARTRTSRPSVWSTGARAMAAGLASTDPAPKGITYDDLLSQAQ